MGKGMLIVFEGPDGSGKSTQVPQMLLDSGLVAMQEPVTEFLLEAPGGLVPVKAYCADGKAQSIEIHNVPSFADRLDTALEVEGIGTLRVDTAYGGDSFVLVDAVSLGFEIRPEEARELAQLGVRITAAANEQLGFRHPANPDWAHISFCQFTLPIIDEDGVKVSKNTVVIDPGKLDRSPTGTGCSARMAVLHARGLMQKGERFIGKSIIDSRFDCGIVDETRVGERDAIIASIRGRAWISGTHQLMLDPEDPWPEGYRISDTWPQNGKPRFRK